MFTHAGFCRPSKGYISVYGYNMQHTWNIEKVRKMIGVCPQYNLQFDTFTVMENLLFFADIKLIDRVKARLEVRFICFDLYN